MRERELEDVFYPGPVQDGSGYFGVDLNLSDREVFLGHPVVCDRPDLFLQMLNWGPGNGRIEVHNAGEKPVTTTMRSAKGFDLLGPFRKKVTVPAGSSVVVTVE